MGVTVNRYLVKENALLRVGGDPIIAYILRSVKNGWPLNHFMLMVLRIIQQISSRFNILNFELNFA